MDLQQVVGIILVILIVHFIRSRASEEGLSLPLDLFEDAILSTPGLISKYGYPEEIHNITTQDGYQLEIHRIPKIGKQPVLLQHGFLDSSATYVLMGPQKGLAYLLADEGYDVWLGNSRGNRYSRKHIKFAPTDEAFWKFSWHEIGVFDLPAMIDYIVEKTNFSKLHFIGHSQLRFKSFLMICPFRAKNKGHTNLWTSTNRSQQGAPEVNLSKTDFTILHTSFLFKFKVHNCLLEIANLHERPVQLKSETAENRYFRALLYHKIHAQGPLQAIVFLKNTTTEEKENEITNNHRFLFCLLGEYIKSNFLKISQENQDNQEALSQFVDPRKGNKISSLCGHACTQAFNIYKNIKRIHSQNCRGSVKFGDHDRTFHFGTYFLTSMLEKNHFLDIPLLDSTFQFGRVCAFYMEVGKSTQLECMGAVVLAFLFIAEINRSERRRRSTVRMKTPCLPPAVPMAIQPDPPVEAIKIILVCFKCDIIDIYLFTCTHVPKWGSTAFFVMGSERPRYNSKVLLMQALAPVAYLSHSKTPFRRFLGFMETMLVASSTLGIHEFLPSSKTLASLGQTACRSNSQMLKYCSNILFNIAGYNEDQMNMTMLPVVYGHVPAGASLRQLIHFGQVMKSGKFRKFDYGRMANFLRYRSIEPPDYSLTKVSAPIILHYSKNDFFSAPEDVESLSAKLPNVIMTRAVPMDKFNHIDFIWGTDVKKLLYNDVIIYMKRLEASHKS